MLGEHCKAFFSSNFLLGRVDVWGLKNWFSPGQSLYSTQTLDTNLGDEWARQLSGLVGKKKEKSEVGWEGGDQTFSQICCEKYSCKATLALHLFFSFSIQLVTFVYNLSYFVIFFVPCTLCQTHLEFICNSRNVLLVKWDSFWWVSQTERKRLLSTAEVREVRQQVG